MGLRDTLLEKGLVPDFLVRFHVRASCRRRVKDEPRSVTERQEGLTRFIESISGQPLAVQPALPNMQHYEVPTDFFGLVLGKSLKYSCCLFGDDTPTRQANRHLDEAERRMLELSCERAGLAEGQDILELGCGWGSLSLFMAERYPGSSITAMSNSRTQKEYIEGEASRRQIRNLAVITADMNDFAPQGLFDRVVSVEMFEHMRNYQELMSRVMGFLRPDGKLFVHIFTYRGTPYLFDSGDPADWMARHFFAGGMMPSPELALFFAGDAVIEKRWLVNGCHYRKTLEAWLSNMDAHGKEIGALFGRIYGTQAGKFRVFWRVFFMACAEVFGYEGGNRWFVSQYLFRKR